MPPDEENDFLDDDEFVPDQTRPVGVRFGEGQPINRAGRPRGSPNTATIVKRVARRRHRVTVDGKTRRLDTLALVLNAVRKKAAQGDLAAFNLQQRLTGKFAPDRQRRQGILICPQKLTDEEWSAVYGTECTDEEVERLLPYLMRARREFQQYQADVTLQLAASLDRFSRATGP